jgi:hypothetical protein
LDFNILPFGPHLSHRLVEHIFNSQTNGFASSFCLKSI